LQQHGVTLQPGQPFDRTNPTFQAAATTSPTT
jgi:hypothetical protein